MPTNTSPAVLFRVWFGLGLKSFGGGPMMLTLMRRAAVDEQHWLDAEEFTRLWSLCQLTPGINLLALTVLIGHRLGGIRGVGACLAGLLLPSVTLTILITAAYARLERFELTEAAVRGVIPATVGLGLATARHLAAPLIAAARRREHASLWASIALAGLSALAFAVFHPPVPALLLPSAAVFALVHLALHRAGKGRPS